MDNDAVGSPRAAVFAVLALAFLGFAPVAQAVPQPAIYFLHDAALPAGAPGPLTGVPLAPGELVTLAPPGLPPANTSDPATLPNAAMQAKAPETRLIQPGQDLVLPVMFNSNGSANTGRIHGPVITLLFLPNTPLVQQGNLSIQLVVVPKGASFTDVPPRGEVIASASMRLDAGNTSTLPNATGMVPPNPADPAAALGYIQGQLMAYGFSQLASSYKVAFLTNESRSLVIDRVVDSESTVQLRLSLTPGASPFPIAVAAGQPLVYWSALTPSFVYVPWYAADPSQPERPATQTPGPGTSPNPGSTSTSAHPGATTTTQKKSPALETALFVAALLGLALLGRRKK